MKLVVIIIIIIEIVLQIDFSHSVSYNIPKFCPNATWNFPISSLSGKIQNIEEPVGIFVDRNNTIYVTSEESNNVTIWSEQGKLIQTIKGNLSNPQSIFVTDNGDIYIDNGDKKQVEKWTLSSTAAVPVMNVEDQCHGLFVDSNNSIYCSLGDKHRVMKSNGISRNQLETVAGNGAKGNALDRLNTPLGILVDSNFTLYVADYGNDRVIKFLVGQKTGVIVAGNGSSSKIRLSCPTSVALDADENIFILDSGQNRILMVTGNKSQDVVKWTFGIGHDSDNDERRFSFDSRGNIHFTTSNYGKVFMVPTSSNSCDGTPRSTSSPTRYTTSTNVKAVTTISTTQSTVTSNQCSDLNDPSCFLGFKIEYIYFDEKSNCSTNTTVSPQTTEVTTKALISTSNKNVSVPPSASYKPNSCEKPSMIGPDCKTSALACDVIELCELHQFCSKNVQLETNPMCSCLTNFNRSICESFRDPCESYFCDHDGERVKINGSCHCKCPPSRNGTHCELRMNFCQNFTCLNRGICFSLEDHAECRCLGTNFYSGKHCEIVATKVKVFRFVSKSVSWVAIVILVAFVLFIVIMDILKYGFGIDPVAEEREKLRAERRKRPPPVVQRFVYVN